MTGCPQAPKTALLALVAFPSAALPAGLAAQVRAEPDGDMLGAAVAEALRSPFHAPSGTGGRVAVALAGPARATAPAAVHSPTDSLPSFGWVFVPTLAVTYLTDVLAYAGTFGPGAGDNYALILTVPAFVPGLVAGRIGGRYGPALAGSALGTAVALLSVKFDSLEVILAAPAVHAALTTWMARGFR